MVAKLGNAMPMAAKSCNSLGVACLGTRRFRRWPCKSIISNGSTTRSRLKLYKTLAVVMHFATPSLFVKALRDGFCDKSQRTCAILPFTKVKKSSRFMSSNVAFAPPRHSMVTQFKMSLILPVAETPRWPEHPESWISYYSDSMQICVNKKYNI